MPPRPQAKAQYLMPHSATVHHNTPCTRRVSGLQRRSLRADTLVNGGQYPDYTDKESQ